MNRERTDAVRFAMHVEPEGEKCVRGLGLTISFPPVVAATMVVRIVEVDVGKAMRTG
jgi:hypothetical protein